MRILWFMIFVSGCHKQDANEPLHRVLVIKKPVLIMEQR